MPEQLLPQLHPEPVPTLRSGVFAVLWRHCQRMQSMQDLKHQRGAGAVLPLLQRLCLRH